MVYAVYNKIWYVLISGYVVQYSQQDMVCADICSAQQDMVCVIYAVHNKIWCVLIMDNVVHMVTTRYGVC